MFWQKINNNLLLIEDGLKLFLRSKKKQFFKAKKYSGNSTEICEQIIQDCYHKEKKYFRVSPNNINQFYARDFGMICESLINLGYEQEVINTINYAMKIYEKKGTITTQINTRNKPLDFPTWTPESTSYMLNSIILTKNKELIKKYKPFFEKQAKIIYEDAINKETGLLRKDKNYSSMKDYSKQQSSCYVNCFVALLAKNLKKIGIKSEFDKHNYEEQIIKHFWKENHFIDDLSGKNIISGDANVYPFWTGIIKNKAIFKKALKTIKQRKLDEPFALKYNNKEDKMDWHILNIINTNYEHDTIWMHLAICYYKVLNDFNEVNELKKQLLIQTKLIEQQKSFYEVYKAQGRPFRSLVFEHDEAMSWCAVYLDLAKKHLFFVKKPKKT